MKALFIFVITFAMALFVYAGESRLVNGVPEFAVAKVKGIVCWNAKERDDLVASFSRFSSTSPFTVENLSPSALEQVLKDSGIAFVNYTDFKNCVDSKSYLDDKILDLKPSEARAKEAKIELIKKENNKR